MACMTEQAGRLSHPDQSTCHDIAGHTDLRLGIDIEKVAMGSSLVPTRERVSRAGGISQKQSKIETTTPSPGFTF